MPVFELATEIKRKSPREVYNFLKEMERLLAPIIGLKIEPLGQKSYPVFHNHWQIDLDGAPLAWIQENRCQPSLRKLRFHQTKGDFADFRGHWQVEKTDRGSRLRLRLEINYGLVNFEKMIGAKLAAKTEALANFFILAIKKQLRRAVSSPLIAGQAKA